MASGLVGRVCWCGPLDGRWALGDGRRGAGDGRILAIESLVAGARWPSLSWSRLVHGSDAAFVGKMGIGGLGASSMLGWGREAWMAGSSGGRALLGLGGAFRGFASSTQVLLD